MKVALRSRDVTDSYTYIYQSVFIVLLLICSLSICCRPLVATSRPDDMDPSVFLHYNGLPQESKLATYMVMPFSVSSFVFEILILMT